MSQNALLLPVCNGLRRIRCKAWKAAVEQQPLCCEGGDRGPSASARVLSPICWLCSWRAALPATARSSSSPSSESGVCSSAAHLCSWGGSGFTDSGCFSVSYSSLIPTQLSFLTAGAPGLPWLPHTTRCTGHQALSPAPRIAWGPTLWTDSFELWYVCTREMCFYLSTFAWAVPSGCCSLKTPGSTPSLPSSIPSTFAKKKTLVSSLQISLKVLNQLSLFSFVSVTKFYLIGW